MTGGQSQYSRALASVALGDEPHAPIIAPFEALQVEQPDADPDRAPLWRYLALAAVVAAVILHHFNWQAQL